MKKARAVRLLDVAKRAGVGVGTASRVLNNEPSVGEDKRRRVLQAISDMGYQRNAVARSLKVSATKTVGVIIPDIANEFYSEIVRGAEDVASGAHYSIILSNTDSVPEQERRVITLLREKQVDGFMMISHSMHPETLDCLKKTGIPAVLVSTAADTQDFLTVGIDNRQAAQEAVEYLIARGHRTIAMLAGPATDADGSSRLQGYRAALEAHGILYDEGLVERGAYNYEAGNVCMERLLERRPAFTAVFAASDHMAIGCLKALSRHGLFVPRDVSVIGFDNLSISGYILPGLTTVNQPRYQMGQTAMLQLCMQLAGDTPQARSHVMRHSIIERDSVMVML